jgi:nitrous oxide reductase accessory protein NosL
MKHLLMKKSAILFRFGSNWVMETRLSGSFHANCTHTFKTAKEARAFAKRHGMRLKRAAACDSLGD